MSTGLSVPHANQALAYVESEASACWNKLLNAAFGPNAFNCEVPHPSPEPDDCVWFKYDFTPQLGCSAFGLNRAAAVALGGRLLAAKSLAGEDEHHAMDATGHLIAQLAGAFATSLALRLKKPVASAESLDTGAPPASPYDFAVAFGEQDQDSYAFFIRLSDQLVRALQNPSSPSASFNAGNPPAAPGTPRNLELLLDVEMPVSVSFGSTRLLLKDIAKLSTGSLIELNRSLSEPVQLVVNNCSIARAEVVVVDGKFGVRITEIMSRHDRLRSLT